MTEDHWLTTNTAPELLRYIADRTNERKLRLFACAACRRIRSVMQYEASRHALEVSERYADGHATWEELHLIESEAEGYAQTAERLQAFGWNAAMTAAMAANRDARLAAERAAHRAADSDLVREHFGNPFRPLLLAADIVFWQESTILRLAQAAYAERILPAGTLENSRLFILADALEEAGCTDEQILTHLRGGGPHYRGCWAIDWLLGKP